MTRSRGPLPARAVALAVVGRGIDDTIDALVADGTTWGGSVTLRITVDNQNGAFGSSEHATACYRYRFTYPRASDWGTPHKVNCGNLHALDLSKPALPDGVTARTRAAVVQVVARLTAAQRSDPATLTRAIRSALGSDYTIAGGPNNGGAFVRIRYGDGCLSVDTSSPAPQIGRPLEGLDCFGG